MKNVFTKIFIFIIWIINIVIFFILYDFVHRINYDKSYLSNEKQYNKIIDKAFKINILKVKREEKQIKYVLSSYSNVDITLITKKWQKISLHNVKIWNIKSYLTDNIKSVIISFKYRWQEKKMEISKDDLINKFKLK